MPLPRDAAIREAGREDAALVLAFIRELANYERLLQEVEASEELIAAALAGPSPRVFGLLAECGGKPAGFALWFYSFSTFRGRHGVYLEDLYVRPAFRGRGIGRALLARLAARCRDEGLARLEWSVLDWNSPSIGFYRGLGGEPQDGWTRYRLDGRALAELAGG